MTIVIIKDGDAVTTTLAIAKGTLSDHASVIKLVRTYHKSRHHEKTKSVWISWGELVAAKIANTPVQTANNVITINFGSQH